MTNSNRGVLRLIAIFKFFKAATLIILGTVVLRLVHTGNPEALTHAVNHLGLAPGHRYLGQALTKVATLPPNRFKEIGLGSFVYAALFLTEGAGLWLLKPWARVLHHHPYRLPHSPGALRTPSPPHLRQSHRPPP